MDKALAGVIIPILLATGFMTYATDERTKILQGIIEENAKQIGTLREKVSSLEYSCKKEIR